MKLINVSNHKRHLKVSCPIYFSNTFLRLLESKKNNNKDAKFKVILSILTNIFSKSEKACAARLYVYLVEKILPKPYTFIVFSASINGVKCLVCIRENEVVNFSKNTGIIKRNGFRKQHKYFLSFIDKPDTLLLSPLLKKEKVNIDTFFDKIQAFHYVESIRSYEKAILN